MGQCSRRKRQRSQSLKNGHSPQAAPRTASRPTGDPVIDFLQNVNLTDLLIPPSGPRPEPKPEPEPKPAGQDTAGANEARLLALQGIGKIQCSN
jgi:hypothetical protein